MSYSIEDAYSVFVRMGLSIFLSFHNQDRRALCRKNAEELISIVKDAKHNDGKDQASFSPPAPFGVFLTINVHITPLTTAIVVTLSTQNNIINFLLNLVSAIESRTKALLSCASHVLRSG